jgi:hypothetical protein
MKSPTADFRRNTSSLRMDSYVNSLNSAMVLMDTYLNYDVV